MSSYLDNMTHKGNAQLLVEQFKDKLRFDVHSKKWMIWNDDHWEHRPKYEHPEMEIFRQFIKQQYDELSTLQNYNQQALLYKWINKIQTKHAIKHILRLASQHQDIQVTDSI